jgi:hypothetical protein
MFQLAQCNAGGGLRHTEAGSRSRDLLSLKDADKNLELAKLDPIHEFHQ